MADDLFGNTMHDRSPLVPSERRWLPNEMLDETIPAPRERPEDWLVKGTSGEWWITDEESEEGVVISLVPGDTVGFCWTRSWGSVPFTIRPDGSFSTPTELPSEANCFAEVGEIDTLMESPKAFAREYAATLFPLFPEAENEVEVLVAVYQWSDTITFRLMIDPAGDPSLEEVRADA